MTNRIDQTIFSVSAPDRQKPRHWLSRALGILLAITMISLAGPGHAIHCIAGTLLLLGCGLHTERHRRWIQAVIQKTPKNLTPTIRRNRRLVWGLLISGAVCGLSGLATLPAAHDPGHLLLPLLRFWDGIHTVSGLVFLGFNIFHLASHRKQSRKVSFKSNSNS